MNWFFLLFFIIFFHSADGSINSLFQRFALPRIAPTAINNALLGLFYYFQFYKTEQNQQLEIQNFINDTKPWVDSPEYLRKYEPRIYSNEKFPVKNPLSFELKHNMPFYIINGKLYISHQAVFKYKLGDISDKDLFLNVLFEYERQQFYPSFNNEHLIPFCGGILKVIAIKNVSSGLLYPMLRPSFKRLGINFSWTYPKIAIHSILDLLIKLYSGISNVTTTMTNKYIESKKTVMTVWHEARVIERVEEIIKNRSQEKN